MRNAAKSRAARLTLAQLVTLAVALLPAWSGCTSSKGHSPAAAMDVRPRFEELSTEIPTGFSDAKRWNQDKICPEGSVLTPFTRYDYDPGEPNHGFRHYFGRSCAILQGNEPETLGRKLASTSSGSSVTIIPHGPYIWWYETGRRMEVGSFDHGTLSTEYSRYEPDGSMAAKD